MDQHPVPQNISSYEFRLVGDMTLKQFFQLAGGIGMAFIFYKMPLPFFLQWPLIGLSVLTGVMLAFVPVSGRPFSQWLMAFIHAIYSPTEYTWQQSSSEPLETTTNNELPIKNETPLDKLEAQVIGRVGQLFAGTAPITTAPPPPVSPVNIAATAAPLPQATETTVHVVAPKPVAPAPLPPVSRPIMVTEVVDMPVPTKPAVPLSTSPQPVPQSAPVVTTYAPQTAAVPATSTTLMATPERPNIIAGLVTNPVAQPLDGVIIEITDNQNGVPVRALRSNKLGQWQTATPLVKGNYNIVAEKEGFMFIPVSITIEDKIVNPLLISAHG